MSANNIPHNVQDSISMAPYGALPVDAIIVFVFLGCGENAAFKRAALTS